MRKLLLVLALLMPFYLISQGPQMVKLSVYSEVSILTVGPGDELFTSFGHTAIHVKDPIFKLDIVFNYGMFDFNQPNFYVNFAKGKLLYKLGTTTYPRFIQQNAYEQRWVKEQILNLTQQQRQVIFEFLANNVRPQNASYLYDPFFNNCATKPIDILENNITGISLNDNFVDSNKSIRQLMNDELHQNTWGSFGINLALGNKIDKSSSLKDYLYLPDFVYKSLQKGTIKVNGNIQPLVKKEKDILQYDEIEPSLGWLNPFVIFCLLLFLGAIISYKDFRAKKISHWFDISLLAVTGIVGIGIMFLWFFTDHQTTPNNLNVLWCFPLNMAILCVYKKKKLLVRYFQFLLLLLIGLSVIWLSKIQEFNMYLIPILLVLGLRYLIQIQLLSSKQ